MPIIGVEAELKRALNFIIGIILILLSGCSKGFLTFHSQSQTAITGKVLSSITLSGLNCSDPLVSVYKIDSQGVKEDPSLATSPVRADGSFTLEAQPEVSQQISSATHLQPYLLEVSGCASLLRRLVSGPKDQNLSQASTLLSQLTSQSILQTAASVPFNKLLRQLEAETSEQTAYTALSTDPQLSSEFTNVFQAAPTVLYDVAPTILSATTPATIAEGSSASVATSAQHWHSSYDLVTEWRETWTEAGVDKEKFISANSTITWTPSENSQGSRNLRLLVGQNNGAGRINLSKPFRERLFTVAVSDAYPVSVPTVNFSGTVSGGVGYTNSASINLTLLTGGTLADGSFANCQNFSDLAIIEHDPANPTVFSASAPQSEASWSIHCTTASTQPIPFTLQTGTGHKILKVWARDSAGQVVLTPWEIPVRYTTASPTLSFLTPASSSSVNGLAFTLTGTCSSYAGSVTLSGPLDDGAGHSTLTATCSLDSWSANLSLTGGDGSKAISISQTDPLGYVGTASRTFVKDTAAPSLTSTTVTGYTKLASVTLTGTCESGLSVQASGTGLSSSTTAACASGTFSQSATFSTGEGAKNLTLTQVDGVGNQTSLNLSFTLDQTAPLLTISSPASAAHVQGTITLTGTCESGLTVNFNGDVSASSSTACSSGAYSQSVTLSAGEGTKEIIVSQVDQATNATTVTRSFVKDTTPPILTIASPVASTPSQNGATVSGTCEDGLNISASGDITGAPSATCASGAYSIAVTFSGTEGSKSITLSESDAAANISTASLSLLKDTTAPGLTQTAVTSGAASSSAVTFSGACETGLSVSMTGAETGTLTCSSGTWSHLSTLSADGLYTYTFSQTDAALNARSVSTIWRRDTIAPQLQASSFKLNSSAASSSATNVNLATEFVATDSGSGVKDFCLVYNNPSLPAPSDPCWIGVSTLGLSTATTIAVTPAQNFYFQTGYAIGDYDVYLWVRDAAGLASSLTNAGAGTIGRDHLAIHYDPGLPPTIHVFSALSVNLPANPPLTAQLQAPAGTDVYLRWRITDDSPILNGNIKLSYLNPATNTWLDVPGGEALNNGANGSCSADDPLTSLVETGCFHWSNGSPSNSPYQIRLVVKDSSNQSEQNSSAPLNTNGMRVIAGNTDPGINGSARTAVFFPLGSGEAGHNGQFIVAPNGNVFMRDHRGLLRIKPTDGALRIFIPYTGSVAAPNLPASQMTVGPITSIALDQSGLVLMRSQNRIYRFDPKLEDPTIHLIAGGSSNPADGTPALDAWLEDPWAGYDALFATPNGRIYFAAGGGMRYLDPITNTIQSLPLGGTGAHNIPSLDVAACKWKTNFGAAFNPATSDLTTLFGMISGSEGCNVSFGHHPFAAFNPTTFQSLGAAITPINHPNSEYAYYIRWVTGVNGSLYGFSVPVGQFYKYNGVTNTMERIFGGTGIGTCEDNTLASACSVAPQDIFIDKFGKVYFLEGGRIRTIQDNNRLLTLYGATKVSGDNGAALAARMTGISTVAQGNDGTVFVLQSSSHVIRRFTSGGNIFRHAGNGNSGVHQENDIAISSPVLGNLSFGSASRFAIDQTSNDLYMGGHANSSVSKLDFLSGRWGPPLIGGGAMDFSHSDGSAGTDVMFYGDLRAVSFEAGKLVIGHYVHHGPSGDQYFVKAYDSTDQFRLSTIAGNLQLSTSTTPCANGNNVSSCFYNFSTLNTTAMGYDPVDNKFILPVTGGIYISRADQTLEVRGGYGGAIAFAYRRVSGSPDQEFLYWCGWGNVYKTNMNSGAEQMLYSSVLGMGCTGASLSWNETTKKLLFPFSQNSLEGVAEISDP